MIQRTRIYDALDIVKEIHKGELAKSPDVEARHLGDAIKTTKQLLNDLERDMETLMLTASRSES